MTISKIREVIQRANWNRQDATGGTRDENRRCNLPEVLREHREALASLVIPARFTRDILNREWAVEMIDRALDRWREAQTIVPILA